MQSGRIVEMDSTHDTGRKSVMAQQHLQLTLNVPKECKSLELSTLPTPLESKEQIRSLSWVAMK